jgi:predicted O-methyltransferase YrrM
MKWLRRNLKNRFLRALRHPKYTAKALLDDLLGKDERFLASVFNSTPQDIRCFLNEPSERADFAAHMKSCGAVLKAAEHPGNDPYAKKMLIQYSAVRALKPEIIVETGIANGISSSHLLLACHLNGKGHVYSIDIDNGQYLPPGKVTGWIVPDHLRDRWTPLLGDAAEILPKLLSELGEIDIFIHDSLHSYEHMKFEITLSYPRIRAGGVLLVDDENFNSAFAECVKILQPPMTRVIRNIGIMKK